MDHDYVFSSYCNDFSGLTLGGYDKLQNLAELVRFLKGKPHMLVTRYEVYVSIAHDTVNNSKGMSQYNCYIIKEEEMEPDTVPQKNNKNDTLIKSSAGQNEQEYILVKNQSQLNCDGHRAELSGLGTVVTNKKELEVVKENSNSIDPFKTIRKHLSTSRVISNNPIEIFADVPNLIKIDLESETTSDIDSLIEINTIVQNVIEVDVQSEMTSTIDSLSEINTIDQNVIVVDVEPEMISTIDSPSEINSNTQNFIVADVDSEITPAISLDMDVSTFKEISSSVCKSIEKNCKLLRCSLCDLMFQSAESMRAHKMSHSSYDTQPRFKCPLCDYSCKTNTIIVDHAEKNHQVEVHLCLWCRFVALSEDQLANHESQRNDGTKCIITKRMGVERGLCSQCGYVTPDANLLQRHMLVHTEERAFKCPLCPMRFKSANQLRRHAKYHNTFKPFRCSLCPYATHNNYMLTKHVKYHLDEGKHKCRDCNLVFKRVYELKDHAQIVHGSRDYFFCANCTFSCCDLIIYKHHLQTHTGRDRYSCDKCSYTCFIRSQMLKHQVIHSDVTPFVCCLCGCQFRHKNNMRKHLVHHLLDKNFQCEVCGFRTKSKKHLRVHQLLHAEDKVHKCTHCDYSSRYAGNLRKHEVIHFDVQPLSCNLCSYTSKSLEYLRKHRKRKHKLTK